MRAQQDAEHHAHYSGNDGDSELTITFYDTFRRHWYATVTDHHHSADSVRERQKQQQQQQDVVSNEQKLQIVKHLAMHIYFVSHHFDIMVSRDVHVDVSILPVLDGWHWKLASALMCMFESTDKRFTVEMVNAD